MPGAPHLRLCIYRRKVRGRLAWRFAIYALPLGPGDVPPPHEEPPLATARWAWTALGVASGAAEDPALIALREGAAAAALY